MLRTLRDEQRQVRKERWYVLKCVRMSKDDGRVKRSIDYIDYAELLCDAIRGRKDRREIRRVMTGRQRLPTRARGRGSSDQEGANELMR